MDLRRINILTILSFKPMKDIGEGSTSMTKNTVIGENAERVGPDYTCRLVYCLQNERTPDWLFWLSQGSLRQCFSSCRWKVTEYRTENSQCEEKVGTSCFGDREITY